MAAEKAPCRTRISYMHEIEESRDYLNTLRWVECTKGESFYNQQFSRLVQYEYKQSQAE
jgi:hypothetical protein